ncbi:MAG TPA: hypothetical protein VFC22_03140 [Solirubrobacteraceae bacterium]|nr:hypothetical protein [Solirubrobacteraceae bacterium]
MQRTLLAGSATAAALCALAAGAFATTAPIPLVHCDSGQAVPGNPPLGVTPRIVLGRLALPAVRHKDVTRRTDVRPFHWWSKAPLAIRAGTTAVALTVPPAWRTRVAITYGDSGPEVAASALRFQTCPAAGTSWNAYPGGFFTATRVCFPLDMTVGHRTTTVQTGTGVRC